MILEWIDPFQAISSNFWLSWQKSPLHSQSQTGKNCFRLDLSISGNFQQQLVQMAGKPPPGAEQGNFLDWIQHISGNFSATFCSIGRNSLQSLAGKTFKLDSSVPGNFQQLSIQVAETPSSAKYGTFLDWIYLFQAISSNFGFRLAQKAPCLQELNYGNVFRKDISISGNSQELCVQLVAECPPPKPNRETFLDCIY